MAESVSSATPPACDCPDAWHRVGGPDDEDFRADPDPGLAHLREVDPVNETPLGFWRISRYEDCVRLLREVPTGVRHADGHYPGREDGSQGPGEFMLQQDPPNHTRLRKLVAKGFTPRATERWRPRAQVLADELIDEVERRNGLEPGEAARRPSAAGELDVIADLALPVPSTLICEMLGVPVSDRDRFTIWTADATHGLAGDRALPEVRQRAMAAATGLADYFTKLIEERRGQPGDDLLTTLIRAEEEGDQLSPTELLVQCIGLLIAGFETTIGLIGNGMRQLILNPGELERLRKQPELVPSAVEECLRFDPPVGLTLRVTREETPFETPFGTRVIPADAQVFVMLRAANKDPEHFPDPTRFDVARNDRSHISFGGGTHLCLGTHLARMEAQVAIGTLVRRLPGLSLEDEQVEWGRSLFRVPGRLPVRFGFAS